MAGSRTGLREIGCKVNWLVHIFPIFAANETTIGYESAKPGKQAFRRKVKARKICRRPGYFQFLRSLAVSQN